MGIRIFVYASLGVFLLAPVAFGAPGDTAPGGGASDPTDFRDQAGRTGDVPTPQREATASVGLDGRIADAKGKPLMDVSIKLFVDGVTAAATTSRADGSFRLVANPMRRDNGSAVIWVQSPDPEKYLDANVVLWASDAAKSSGLFSPCTRSLEGTVSGTLEVTMRSVDEQKAAVVASKCLDGS